ncbi:hypothetical protein GWK47_029979 [Chionoecetes opilio]|uniref:Uncharacterized protein n=1 Tax=Chionoecetes opilio TaxID=41210 RepID=A0A8J5D2S2_CHIOP|nr:hypothetical protein GWK47_029979 [Chionoecetes opilio]
MVSLQCCQIHGTKSSVNTRQNGNVLIQSPRHNLPAHHSPPRHYTPYSWLITLQYTPPSRDLTENKSPFGYPSCLAAMVPMPRNYQPRNILTTDRTNLEKAFNHRIETGCSIRTACNLFGVKVSTLGDAFTRSLKESDGRTFVPKHQNIKKVFTDAQEHFIGEILDQDLAHVLRAVDESFQEDGPEVCRGCWQSGYF